MTRDAAGGWRSRGRSSLVRVLQECRQQDIARRCGCARSTIAKLASGALRLPSLPVALALTAYAIEPSAWLSHDD